MALLKEVAGTRVYEIKRLESLKIMKETWLKREKINELLSYIESRLEELEVEKSELNEFQALDKDRRCLEYAIYSKEQEAAVEEWEELEEAQGMENDLMKAKIVDFSLQEENLKVLTSQVSQIKSKIEVISVEREGLLQDREYYLKSKAIVELSIKDIEENHAQKQESLVFL